MIASLSGTVTALSPVACVVDVGGVGMLVQCTPGTLARLRVGERAVLATTLVVRETELTLYGFGDTDERDVFEILQAAGGVGPKLAQAVLGVHSPDEIRRAVAEEDLSALTKVPGIGRKGAQRIVLDLAGRLGPPAGQGIPAARAAGPAAGAAVPRGGAAEQVREALVGLGYSAREAEDAVAAAAPAAGADTGAGRGDGVATAVLLRAALAVLRPR